MNKLVNKNPCPTLRTSVPSSPGSLGKRLTSPQLFKNALRSLRSDESHSDIPARSCLLGSVCPSVPSARCCRLQLRHGGAAARKVDRPEIFHAPTLVDQLAATCVQSRAFRLAPFRSFDRHGLESVGIKLLDARTIALVLLLRFHELYVILRDRTKLALAIEVLSRPDRHLHCRRKLPLLRSTNDSSAVPAWDNSMMRRSRRTFRSRSAIRHCGNNENKRRKRS